MTPYSEFYTNKHYKFRQGPKEIRGAGVGLHTLLVRFLSEILVLSPQCKICAVRYALACELR